MDDTTELTERGHGRPRCGAYELFREVGRGGMGSVWEARHALLARRVAVKILHGEYARNPELLARFLREGVASARVEHPHVASVIDVGQDDDRAWLVMEYLDGEDLAKVLERQTRMEPAEALAVLLPALAGLSVAHREGVVHRDFKPGNIFLARDRNGVTVPKIVDFGFSKIQETDPDEDLELTRADTALGTLSYMPLEQVRSSRSAGPACDQYAAAVTLYRCLTGELPYTGRNNHETFAAIARGNCRRPSEIVPTLPAGLDEVVLRAMQRLPEARFPSVLAFGAALLPFASPATRARWAEVFGAPPPRVEAPAAAPASPTAPPAPTRSVAPWTVVALALTTAVALCEFALLVTRR